MPSYYYVFSMKEKKLHVNRNMKLKCLLLILKNTNIFFIH